MSDLFSFNVCREEAEAIFNAALGGKARQCDLDMATLLCGFANGQTCTLGEACDAAAEYVWDHHLGEPEEPNLEQVQKDVREVIADVVERTRAQPEGLGGLLLWPRFEQYARLVDLEQEDPPPGV